MNDEIRLKLSAYLDGALPADERRALEVELSRSRDLQRELEELREVSKLVKDLPREKLPPGFLTRLASRRAADLSPADPADEMPVSREASWVFLPPAYRPVALALSSLVIAVVVWDKLGEKPEVVMPHDGLVAAVKNAADAPPTQYDFSAKLSAAGASGGAGNAMRAGNIDSSLDYLKKADKAAPQPVAASEYSIQAPPVAVDDHDERRNELVARRERAKAPGKPLAEMDSFGEGRGADGTPIAMTEPPAAAAPAASAASAALMKTAKAGSSFAAVRGAASTRSRLAALKASAMTEEERSARNEELYKGLEKEKKRMGIAGVMPKDETTERAMAVLSASGRAESSARIDSATPALLSAQEASVAAKVLRSAQAYRAYWIVLGLPGQPPAADFSKEMIVVLPQPGSIVSVLESDEAYVVTWRPVPGDPATRLQSVPISDRPVTLTKE